MKARVAVSLVLALFAAFVFSKYLRRPVDKPLVDFKAFYCAARAVTERRDPYRFESVATCEQSPSPPGTFAAGPDNVIPAPLPGYDLVLFVPLALLPYDRAAAVDLATTTAAIVAAIFALRRAIALPWATQAAVLLPLGLAVDVVTGQTAAFALLGLAAAAAARDPRDRVAGLALAMVQPNVGIAAALAVGYAEPRMRRPLAGAAAALAAVSLVALGFGAARGFALETLPEAARNAAADPTEYGTIWLLGLAGVPAALAVAAGVVTSIAGIAAGVFAGATLARRCGDPRLLTLVPPAFAVAGAGYLHEAQFVLVVPAALALAALTSGPVRAAALACGFLAGTPWPELNVNWTLIASVVAVAPIVPVSLGAPRVVVHGAWVLALACCIVVGGLSPRAQFGPAIAQAAPVGETTEAAWGRVQARESIVGAGQLAGIKAPSALGTLGIAGLALALARRRRRRRRASLTNS